MYKEIDLLIPGYVIDDATINELDSLSRSFFDKDNLKLKCTASINRADDFEFKKIEDLIACYSKKPTKKESLLIYYTSDNSEEISFNFKNNGSVSIFMKGKSEEGDIILNRIKNTINKCDPSYSAFLKLLISPRLKAKLTNFFIFIFFMLSLYLAFQYYYLTRAEDIGVNVDRSILVYENDIYKDIENALKSDSVRIKLDTILRTNLKDFINASDFILERKENIKIALILLTVFVILYLLYYLLNKLYPNNLFVFESRKNWYSRFIKRREIIWVTIIIGFIINVGAGLFIIFITI